MSKRAAKIPAMLVLVGLVAVVAVWVTAAFWPAAALASLADGHAAPQTDGQAEPTDLAYLITIPAKAEVRSATIRLGDIATITPVLPVSGDAASPAEPVLSATAATSADIPEALRALELSPAALPGQARYLSRSVVEAKLRYAGFAPSTYRLEMPPSVTVRTQSQVVGREKAEALLRPQVVEAVDYPGGAVEFGLTLWPTLTLLPGEVSLAARVDPSRLALGIQSGLLVFPVDVFLDGSRVTSVTARASLVVKDRVVVAARDLTRNHVIGPEDVQVVEKSLAGLPPDAPRDAAKIIGLRTTRPIKSGLVFSGSDLEPPPAVNVRQNVWITVVSGGIRVTAQGVALEEGVVGQTIRVQNLESKRIIIARVTAPGQVFVELSPRAESGF